MSRGADQGHNVATLLLDLKALQACELRQLRAVVIGDPRVFVVAAADRSDVEQGVVVLTIAPLHE